MNLQIIVLPSRKLGTVPDAAFIRHLRQFGPVQVLSVPPGAAAIDQRARLLRRAVIYLSPEIDTIAWCDADVRFSDSYWVRHLDSTLREFSVVQLYSHYQVTGGPCLPSAALLECVTGSQQPGPILAAAARRQFFHEDGLDLESLLNSPIKLDRRIAGSFIPVTISVSPAAATTPISHAPAICAHWKYNPFTMLTLDGQGCWKWTAAAPVGLRKAMEAELQGDEPALLPSLPVSSRLGEPVRHCLGHLYPIAANDLWKWHIQQLVSRLPLFNGRVLLSVALDDTTVFWEDVVAALPPDSEIELQFITNDPKTGERASFLWGLSQLSREMANPNACLFYWHSKGVSVATTDQVHNWTSVRRWAAAMWQTCGDCWPLAQQQLATASVTGAFRQPWNETGLVHYAGTYFWVRLSELLNRPWWRLDLDRWAVERWPGQMFPREKTACLFDDQIDDPTSRGTLYREETWNSRTGELCRFLQTHSTLSQSGVVPSA